MFSNIQVGDYVIIMSGFGHVKKIRRKVAEVKTTIFKCENDSYSYLKTDGRARGMQYRHALQYNEQHWLEYVKEQTENNRRKTALETIKGVFFNEKNFTTDELCWIANNINILKQNK